MEWIWFFCLINAKNIFFHFSCWLLPEKFSFCPKNNDFARAWGLHPQHPGSYANVYSEKRFVILSSFIHVHVTLVLFCCSIQQQLLSVDKEHCKARLDFGLILTFMCCSFCRTSLNESSLTAHALSWYVILLVLEQQSSQVKSSSLYWDSGNRTIVQRNKKYSAIKYKSP